VLGGVGGGVVGVVGGSDTVKTSGDVHVRKTCNIATVTFEHVCTCHTPYLSYKYGVGTNEFFQKHKDICRLSLRRHGSPTSKVLKIF